VTIHKLTVGELAANCLIVPLEEGGCLLADPGGSAEAILARLSRLGLSPKYIVLTHTHFDHIAALPAVAASYPDARVAVHAAERNKLGPDSLELHRRDFLAAGAAGYVDALWEPMPAASLILEEGSKLGPFTVLHLPGHSPGSIGLYCESEKTLISGDTLFNAGYGRTDLPGGDEQALLGSLRRLFAMDGDIAVYPGHGGETTIGREKKRFS